MLPYFAKAWTCPFHSGLTAAPRDLESNGDMKYVHSSEDTFRGVHPSERLCFSYTAEVSSPKQRFKRWRSQHIVPCPLSCSVCSSHSLPLTPHFQHPPFPDPLLTTSSAKRTLSSSGFGIGLENSIYCRGWLSRRLISGMSLPPKQHRKPRPWRLLLRGAMVTAGQEDSQQAGALRPHRDLGGRRENTKWSGMAAR